MPKKKQETEETKTEEKPAKFDQEKFEKKVLELAETGLTAEKIGEKLRKEGMHPKESSKKISKILGSRYINPDLKNIENKLSKLQEHSKKNKGDKRAMRDKERVSAKLRRLRKYLNK